MDLGNHRRAQCEELIRLVERTPPLSFVEAKQLLEENQWNLDAAVTALGHRRRPRSCFDSWIFSYVVRFWKATQLFVGSFGPSPTRQLTQVDAHRSFLLSYEAEYGAYHPDFVEGTLFDAVVKSKRSCKFLLVYLHSWSHGDTPQFCRGTLASEAVVEFINRNFVFWAVDVSSRSGYEAAATLKATSFPFMTVLYSTTHRTTDLQAFGSLIGPLGVDELLSQLMGLMEEHDAVLVADRLEIAERERNRNLLKEQDEEYERGLKHDREKQRLKEQGEESGSNSYNNNNSRSNSEEEIGGSSSNNNNAADSVNKGKEEEGEEEPIQKRRVVASVVEEPGPDEKNVVEVAFRLPNGRFQRRFRAGDSIKLLFNFVDSKVENQAPYMLVSAYPRVVYTRDSMQTFEECNFSKKTSLLYEEEDE